LAAGDVAYYAMHTNFDVMGMAALNGESLGLRNSQVLEVTYEEGCSEQRESAVWEICPGG
jgi:putative NIF3 family GTP cyclohydrolase 1 type 2